MGRSRGDLGEMWRLHPQEERVCGEVLRAVGHEEQGRGVGEGEAEHAQHLARGEARGVGCGVRGEG